MAGRRPTARSRPGPGTSLDRLARGDGFGVDASQPAPESAWSARARARRADSDERPDDATAARESAVQRPSRPIGPTWTQASADGARSELIGHLVPETRRPAKDDGGGAGADQREQPLVGGHEGAQEEEPRANGDGEDDREEGHGSGECEEHAVEREARTLIGRPPDELGEVAELALQLAADLLAEGEHALVGDRVERVGVLLSAAENPGLVEDTEVLGDVLL